MAMAEGLGIPQLDRLLAGMPLGTSLVLVNDPGVEAEPFLYQAAHAHIVAGRTVVYAVLARPPSGVRRGMMEYGFEEPPGGRLVFIDAFSPLMGASEGAPYTVPDMRDPTHFTAAVARAAVEHPDAVLLIDSLSTLADQAGSPAFRAALPALQKAAHGFRMSAALFTDWPYGEDVAAALATFDGVVRLKGVEERVMTAQYFLVERAAWPGAIEHTPLAYRALRPGGVHVYIPKILVTGPFDAGKSTFIRAVSETSVNVDRLGTTVALDHGRVTVDGLIADVFGTPGQARFDPILKTVAAQALGVLVMVDATKPGSFDRARDLLERTCRQGLPALIVANKQDQPGALRPDDVARLMRPPANVRVVGAVASDRASSRAALQTLIDQILAGGVAA